MYTVVRNAKRVISYFLCLAFVFQIFVFKSSVVLARYNPVHNRFCIEHDIHGKFVCMQKASSSSTQCYDEVSECERALKLERLRWDNKKYNFTSNGNGMTGAEAGAYYHNQINKKEKQKTAQDYVTVAGGVVAAVGLAMTVGAAIGVKNNDSLKGALIGSGIGMMVGGGVTAYVANKRSKDTAKELRSLRYAQEDNVENMINTEYVQNQFANNTYSGYNKDVNKHTVTGLNGRQYFKSDNGDVDLGGRVPGKIPGDGTTIPPGGPGTSGPLSGDGKVNKPCIDGNCEECYNDGNSGHRQCERQGLNAYDNCKKTTYNSYISDNLGNLTHILKTAGISIYGPDSAYDCCKQAARIQKKDFSTYQGYDKERGCLFSNSGDGDKRNIGWDIINGNCVECIDGRVVSNGDTVLSCTERFKSKDECLNAKTQIQIRNIFFSTSKSANGCEEKIEFINSSGSSLTDEQQAKQIRDRYLSSAFPKQFYFSSKQECILFYTKFPGEYACCALKLPRNSKAQGLYRVLITNKTKTSCKLKPVGGSSNVFPRISIQNSDITIHNEIASECRDADIFTNIYDITSKLNDLEIVLTE